MSSSRQAYDRSFGGRRFNWLKQIVADRKLPPLALHVAMVLAKNLHSKPGEQYFTSWLCQGTIAADLDVTDRAVRTAIAALGAGGHLAVTQRGHHKPAIYKPLQTGTDIPASDHEDRNETSGLNDSDRNETSGLNPSDRKFDVNQTGTKLPTEEDKEENDSREEDSGGSPTNVRESIPEKNRRRVVQTPWPDGFVLDDDMTSHAADKAGWDIGRAFTEFDRFQNFHRSKGTMFADWKAAWRTWVANGIRYDRERGQQQQGGPVIIDQNGNRVNTPPPWQTKQPFRRRSNSDFAFEVADDD
jgi:hypothetical protein